MERADIDWSLTSPKMLRERIFDCLPSLPADELKIVLTDFCLIGSALPERKAVKAVKAVSSKRSSEDTTTNVFGGIGSSLREPFCPPSPPTSSRTSHRLLSHRRRAFRMQKRSKRSKRSHENGSAVWLTHHSKSLADELKIVLTDFCLIGSALPERKAVKAVKAVSSKRSSEDTTTNVFGGIGSSLREPFCPPSPPTSSRTTHRLLSHRRRAFRIQKPSKRSKRSHEKGSAVWLTHKP